MGIVLVLLIVPLLSMAPSWYEGESELEGGGFGSESPESGINEIQRTAIGIAAGYYHTCAILDDGNVSCWGDNSKGQLGIGSEEVPLEVKPTQTAPLGGTGAVKIAAGGHHTCAILDDGNVSCWGDNSEGQLGIDSSDGLHHYPSDPFEMPGSRRAVEIAAGRAHTCAVLDDGTISCWGYGGYGQLGHGSFDSLLSPSTLVDDIGHDGVECVLVECPSAVGISIGEDTTCAILDDGSVSCWGNSAYWALGSEVSTTQNSPIQTANLSESEDGGDRTAVEISSGDFFTCAILDDGSISCWGRGGTGRLGHGSTSDVSQPTQTSSLGPGRTAVAISTGYGHACAILDNGSVSCWGYNRWGQIGIGSVDAFGANNERQPTPTNDLSELDDGGDRTAVGIASGVSHTCAILDDGSVSCWGDNQYGQLGDGHFETQNPSPVQTKGFGTAADTDGDGYGDYSDAFPNDAGEWSDYDGDGVGDNSDAFPNDPTEWVDTDGDGTGDNADTDADGDGTEDDDEDNDGDGVNDGQDDFPFDASETTDSDGDGVGDNSDDDVDGDGVSNDLDAFPLDSGESNDADLDGVGDNEDAFPNDPNEWDDRDGDGVGDNEDAFPLDGTERWDSDGDGIGNQEDSDDDGDGVRDALDHCNFSGEPGNVDSQGCPLQGIWGKWTGLDIGTLEELISFALIVGVVLVTMFAYNRIIAPSRSAKPQFPHGVESLDGESSVVEWRYRKSELIGEGGMANVFRAEKVGSGGPAVWKEAAASRLNPLPEVNRRLLDESGILSSLDHPRIPNHLEYGEIENGDGDTVGVMVMEHIEGNSLKAHIETLQMMNRGFDLDEAIALIGQICEPLEYMMDLEVPVYHRDIKPGNVIVHPSRGPVLIDFGLAKGVASGSDVSLSQGLSEGWSPPERRDGVSGSFTDVFSLGQLLWHVLTGERPFHALSKDEVTAKLVDKGYDEWVAGVIFASAQRHDRRVQSVFELRMMLENEGEMPA